MEHEHTKEATVDAIVKNCERKVFIVNIVRKIFVKLKHGKKVKETTHEKEATIKEIVNKHLIVH